MEIIRKGKYIGKYTQCYNLDLECSPRVHMLKHSLYLGALLGDGGTFNRWGLVERLGQLGQYSLKGDVGTLAPFLSLLLYFLSAMK
jgi:hypothetical protein